MNERLMGSGSLGLVIRLRTCAAAVALACSAIQPAAARTVDLVSERSIDDLQTMLRSGQTSSSALVDAYLKRITQIDKAGPRLNSVIVTNPDARTQATALDAERRSGKVRGPLHGIPILVKDNIETADRMPTTAGSLALKDNLSGRDAPLVARLRAAGAIILGKTNLSEWANIRSTRSSSGWSAVGGLTRNPYALDRNACGSSSGSGTASAASLGAGSIGTETDGSITCPAAVAGLVGLKPTIGLVSRTHVIPISSSQDTAGPMTRSVRDAALLLTAMAGSDPNDAVTAAADSKRGDYTAQLAPGALKGKRIGVLRFAVGPDKKTAAVFETALADLKHAGAELVSIDTFENRQRIREAEQIVLMTELKAGLNSYLATTPKNIRYRTLSDLIAFNEANSAAELRWFGQDRFHEAEATKGLSDAVYLKAKADGQRLAGSEGIDHLLKTFAVTALVAPTTGPAWTTDLVNGDHFGGGGAGGIAAVAGYPHLTVPMGTIEGLPVGISFIGTAWSERDLLGLGYAYEQASRRRRPPEFKAQLP
jgi:amidase